MSDALTTLKINVWDYVFSL